MSQRRGLAGTTPALVLFLIAAPGWLLPARAQEARDSEPDAWLQIVSSGVRVRYVPGDSLRAARILASLLGQPPLPALPPGHPAEVVVYLAPDERAFVTFAGESVPDWGAGVALPSAGTIVVPGYASGRTTVGGEKAVLRHEWAHLGLHDYLGGLRVPRWFDEGYARWAEGGFDASEAWRLRLLLALGRAPPLDSLTLEWPRDRASAEVAYLLAASAVAYLVEESGERGVRVLLERWRASGSFEVALRGTYGVTSGQLEEDWRRWVEERFGWVLVLSNSLTLWGLLGLVLVFMVIVRRRHNRERMARLRACEPAERPAYWNVEGDRSGRASGHVDNLPG